MSLKINLHDIEGVVVKKSQPIPIGNNNMRKTYLYLSCQYLWKGVASEQILRFLTFSWEDHASKFTPLLVGDEIKFSFTISGKMDNEKMDYLGLPRIYNELIPSSKIEIISTANRELYNNGEKDDLGMFSDIPVPKFQYKDQAQREEDDDPASDLPF
jgi:hypothetical protein